MRRRPASGVRQHENRERGGVHISELLAIMGYPNSNHIQEFVRGQTVRKLTTDKDGHAWLELASGEKLRLYPTIERGKAVIIATPFCADGEVKQSTQIMAN